MKIDFAEGFYGPGIVPHREDKHGIDLDRNIFWVADAASEPHLPGQEKIYFNKWSGGRMVVETIASVFSCKRSSASLTSTILKANTTIGRIQLDHDGGLDGYSERGPSGYGPLANAGKLAGASFAVAEIQEDSIRVLSCGDCLVILVFEDRIWVTENKAFCHVSENYRIIDGLMKKHNNDRQGMWTEFASILSERRGRDINNPKSPDCFATINGQPWLKKCWQITDLPLAKLKIILLLTDGFISDYRLTAPEKIQGLAATMAKDYRTIGPRAMLAIKRATAALKQEKSYVSADEATMVTVEITET